MYWLIFTIFAIISRATYSISSKLLSQDIKVAAQSHALLLTGSSAILVLIFGPFFGGIDFLSIFKYPMIIGAVMLSCSFGNIIFFNGQKLLDASMTQIAFSSVLIWGAVLSLFFLNSTFSIYQIFGMLLLLAAIIFTQYERRKFSFNKGVIIIMTAAIVFAIFQVTSAIASRYVNTVTYLFYANLATATLVLVLNPKTSLKDFKIIKRNITNTISKTLFASLTSMIYMIFSFAAYRLAPDRGVVVVLLTSQVIISVIFGVIFLKERNNIPKKIIAGTIAFIAAILINQ
ncbi:hypothetical protein COY14_00840 [Candidatus Roizmanbacteria bacterium CG_4_10_14_0_2_um_filter_36_9]|uniref:EamA domain-containing protein n=1 Tax=Candidatus Roizmanbacteria bacterium CG_4_10_14_0_2_um_filter_36_9 TaxID=1974823 RepID=A0A2M7U5G9_9BACT|nr:MAG: hypothetical protein COY14_00840 [Candidatus Roizmanbacteria bacterium CG_4_10_14_0_2_um_filter_36_9]